MYFVFQFYLKQRPIQFDHLKKKKQEQITYTYVQNKQNKMLCKLKMILHMYAS